MKNFFITLFLGWAGVHKFMQKKIGMGFVYLFTMGLFGIGWFIDIIISFTRILPKIVERLRAMSPLYHGGK